MQQGVSKNKNFGCASFSHSPMSQESQYDKKKFSVIIKRYMSNLKIVILGPWTDQFLINSLSRATVHRKRFKKIEGLSDKIRWDIINTLKGERLCLHFDGKKMNQIQDNLYNMQAYVYQQVFRIRIRSLPYLIGLLDQDS